jgi:hypothetical protein
VQSNTGSQAKVTASPIEARLIAPDKRNRPVIQSKNKFSSNETNLHENSKNTKSKEQRRRNDLFLQGTANRGSGLFDHKLNSLENVNVEGPNMSYFLAFDNDEV